MPQPLAFISDPRGRSGTASGWRVCSYVYMRAYLCDMHVVCAYTYSYLFIDLFIVIILIFYINFLVFSRKRHCHQRWSPRAAHIAAAITRPRPPCQTSTAVVVGAPTQRRSRISALRPSLVCRMCYFFIIIIIIIIIIIMKALLCKFPLGCVCLRALDRCAKLQQRW